MSNTKASTSDVRASTSDVKVFARFRPLNKREIQYALDHKEKNNEPIYHFKNDNDFRTIEIIQPVKETVTGTVVDQKTKEFSFDHIFPETSTQPEIYSEIARPLLADILKGFNCTIMAYGQTGSGKSFTMMGETISRANTMMGETINNSDFDDNSNAGIIPRIVQELFTRIEQKKEETLFTVQCSYVEIYLEKVRDLINPALDNLKIREVIAKSSSSTKQKNEKSYIYIEGCTVCTVKSLKDMMKVMKHGEANRVTATTEMNDRSSRSHSVFILNITQTDLIRQTRKSSKLFLVDLAGSEQVQRSGATGLTLEQAKKINKSLSALSLVIQTLTEKKGKDPHIPYRDSKLTRLLTDSLGGNSKTVLIVALSPAKDSLWETYSSLGFGSRAKKIQNCASINEEISPETYKKLIQTLTRDIDDYKTKYLTIQNDYQLLLSKYEQLLKSGNSLNVDNTLPSITATAITDKPTDITNSEPSNNDVAVITKKPRPESLPITRHDTINQEKPLDKKSLSRKPSVAFSEDFQTTEYEKYETLSDTDECMPVIIDEHVRDIISPANTETTETLTVSDVSDNPETIKKANETTEKSKEKTPSILDDLSMFQTGNLVVWGMDNIFTFEKF